MNMDESTGSLSVSTIAPRPAACRLLLLSPAGRSQPGRVAPHSHPHWQLELPQAGDIRALLGDGEVPLRPGESVLIPPHVVHGFAYEGDCRWTTVRFTAEGADAGGPPEKLEADPLVEGIGRGLCMLGSASASPARIQAAAEGLLAALMSWCRRLTTPDSRPDLPLLVRRTWAAVDRAGGRRISLGAVSNAVGYSPGHVSAAFRQAMGLPLKQHIDRRCAAEAQRLLRYSDLGVSQVAEALGFVDVFTFSRFFKRLVGVSPRAWRSHGGMEMPSGVARAATPERSS